MNENNYKKAMDSVCDKHFNLTAEEMLEIAKVSADTERNITMKSTTKRNIIGKIIGTAAACLVISGTAASAMGYGPLGESFRKFFGKDETTAEIIDQGHYCNIGQDQSDGIFTVMLDSVTGDKSSPKLLFEVTVNDETLAEKNDRIHLFAYILDEDTYQNHIDEYGMWDAYGEKDPEVSNMYHVCMDGSSAFMVNEAEVITAIKQISFDSDPVNKVFNYDVNMEYRFTVPGQALKDTTQIGCSEFTVTSDGGIDYKLVNAEFGTYETRLDFHYDFLGTDLANGETDYTELYDVFDNDWHKLSGTFILEVDGVQYEPKELGYGYGDKEGEALRQNECSTWMTFPGIDYTRVDEITLIAGSETYRIK